jgi:hypothetical protein
MNDKLFDRLKEAADVIRRNPCAAAEVSLLFEEFVSSLEEIAADLAMVSDDQVARDLRRVIQHNITSHQ